MKIWDSVYICHWITRYENSINGFFGLQLHYTTLTEVLKGLKYIAFSGFTRSCLHHNKNATIKGFLQAYVITYNFNGTFINHITKWGRGASGETF